MLSISEWRAIGRSVSTVGLAEAAGFAAAVGIGAGVFATTLAGGVDFGAVVVSVEVGVSWVDEATACFVDFFEDLVFATAGLGVSVAAVVLVAVAGVVVAVGAGEAAGVVVAGVGLAPGDETVATAGLDFFFL